MAGIEVKSLDSPEETRSFADHGGAEVVHVAGRPVMRNAYEPGWRWSEDVKPIAGTGSCQVKHLGYCLAGRMRVVMDDGSEQEIGPGDAASIEPGHDAWVVGDETCVFLDFGDVEHFAKPQ